MKKIGTVILILAMGVWGCVTVDNATVIDVDSQGYANGQFRDTRNGQVADFTLFGGGAGAAASASAASALGQLATTTILGALSGSKNNSSSGGGGGMLGLTVRPAPAQGDPVPFARSIAMINYSKKLKSIKYDESGGIIEYDFEQQPLTQRSSYVKPAQPAPPHSFGFQPVE